MNGTYVRRHIQGVVELSFGKDTGLDHLDHSIDGFYRSFWAVVMTWMLYIPVESSEYSLLLAAQSAQGWSRPGFITLSLGVSVVAFVASLTALYLLCRTPQTQSRFTLIVIAGNWFGALTTIVALPLILIVNRMGDGSVSALLATALVAWIGVTLFAYWRVTRITLMLNNAQTLPFFIIPVAVQIVIEFGLLSALGLPL